MNVFEEIKEMVSMHDICGMLGVTPNKSGFISCPHHKERTPSCKLYLNSFYCFSCNKGGDAIQLVADSVGISPIEAARKIDNYFALGLIGKKNKPAPRKNRKPQNESLEWCNTVYRDVVLDILADICRKVWALEGDSTNYVLLEEMHQDLLESDARTVSEFKKKHGKELVKFVERY